jgi:hypothetical protein
LRGGALHHNEDATVVVFERLDVFKDRQCALFIHTSQLGIETLIEKKMAQWLVRVGVTVNGLVTIEERPTESYETEAAGETHAGLSRIREHDSTSQVAEPYIRSRHRHM